MKPLRALARPFYPHALSVWLLLERHLTLVVVVDLLFLLGLGLGVLVGEASVSDLYSGPALTPLLLVGVPLFANTIAVERTAGSLDLALTVPRTSTYFLRRLLPVAGLLLIQAEAVMVVTWLVVGRSFPLIPVLLQLFAATALLAMASYNWATRLRTAGGVALASLLTVAVLGRWWFFNPVFDLTLVSGGAWLPNLAEPWLGKVVALSLCCCLFAIDAQRRLDRPERLLR